MSQYPKTAFDDRLDVCPFCGAKAVVAGPEFQEKEQGFSIDCDGNLGDAEAGRFCGATVWAETLDQAIASWNRRDQAARIAELERELKEARELARCGGWTK